MLHSNWWCIIVLSVVISHAYFSGISPAKLGLQEKPLETVAAGVYRPCAISVAILMNRSELMLKVRSKDIFIVEAC